MCSLRYSSSVTQYSVVFFCSSFKESFLCAYRKISMWIMLRGHEKMEGTECRRTFATTITSLNLHPPPDHRQNFTKLKRACDGGWFYSISDLFMSPAKIPVWPTFRSLNYLTSTAADEICKIIYFQIALLGKHRRTGKGRYNSLPSSFRVLENTFPSPKKIAYWDLN